MRKKSLLGVMGRLVKFRVELILFFRKVFHAAAGFPLLFVLFFLVQRFFGVLWIGRDLFGIALALLLVGGAGRRRSVVFGHSSCRCAVYWGSVKGAFWGGS